MSEASSTVTMRLKWVLADGQLRALDQSTGAIVQMTRAEGEFGKALVRSGQVIDENARKAKAVGSAYQQMSIAEVRRLMAQAPAGGPPAAGAGPDRQPAAPPDYDRLAADRRHQHWQAEQERAELRARGLNPDGSPVTLAARLAPYTALAAGAAYFGAGVARAGGEAFGNPYLSTRSAGERLLRDVPLAGHVFGLGLDAARGLSGETERFGRTEAYYRDQSVRQDMTNDMNLRLQGLRAEERSARNLADAYQGVRLARPDPSIDRGTAAGRRQFEEEARLLPIDQQRTRLVAQRAAAAKDVQDSLEDEKRLSQEIREIDEKRAEADRRATAAGSSGALTRARADQLASTVGGALGLREEGDDYRAAEQVARNQLALLDKQRKGLQDQYEDAAERTKRRKDLVGEIDKQSDQLTVEARRARYDIAIGREEEASGRARTLSQLGFGGREAAKNALDLARQYGIANLPQETRDLIGQVAPRYLRDLEEKEGERYFADFRGRVGEADRPAFEPLAAARKRTDEARENVVQRQEQADKQAAETAVAAIGDYTSKLTPVIKAAIEVAVNRIRNELMEAGILQK